MNQVPLNKEFSSKKFNTKNLVSTSCLVLSLFLALVQMPPLLAWGSKGHILITRLAASHLTAETSRAITELLGNESLEDVAMWADKIKPARPETAPFHYVSFPKPAIDGLPGSFQNSSSTQTSVLTAIDRFSHVLNDRLRPESERQEALKFLVHLVGDLHQPLHCGTEGDVGGNGILVRYFAKETNLHKVWDFELVETSGLSMDAYFIGLNAEFSGMNRSAEETMTPADWAAEAHAAGVAQAFLMPDDHQLGEKYYEANIRTVNRQICRAGNRLADLLNHILDNPRTVTPTMAFRGNTPPRGDNPAYTTPMPLAMALPEMLKLHAQF